MTSSLGRRQQPRTSSTFPKIGRGVVGLPHLLYCGPLAILLFLLLSHASSCVADVGPDAGRRLITPPTFSTHELIHHERMDALREVLATTGLLAVRLDGDHDDGGGASGGATRRGTQEGAEYGYNREVALDGLCQCYDHPSFLQIGQGDNMDHQQQQQQIRSMVLADQRTVRTTVATATVGMDHPLPLPEGLSELCGMEVVDAMEGLRDQLAQVAQAFVQALDHMIRNSNDGNAMAAPTAAATSPLLKDKHGKGYDSVQAIVQASNHLEHFHVYTSSGPSSNKDAAGTGTAPAGSSAVWDWHTDAGLFLVFVPGWDCHNGHHQDTSFWYQDEHGQPIQAQFDGRNTAIIMLGQGAQDWLDLSTAAISSRQASSSSSSRPLSLKATVHSVRWDEKNSQGQQQQQRRAWYGMMALVPETALIYGAKTLKDVRSSLSLSDSIKNKTKNLDDNYAAVVAIGCGVAQPSQGLIGETFLDGTLPLARASRRRVQHQDPSGCNNVTNFFCWMQCLEVPNTNQAQAYVNDGYSLYCLDPAILASTGNDVSSAAEPCENGWVHNANCLGTWRPTAPGVPAATLNVTAEASNYDNAFCYGGTSMYMDGFHLVQSTTCVIYLLQSWVLNSGGKYAAATIGTFLAAIGLEKIIQQRRKTMSRMESSRPRTRLLATAAFYGTQLTVGYLLMLVIMIYSGVLFMATVLGLVAGHLLFNAKDAFFPLKDGSSTNVCNCEEQPLEEAVVVSEGTAAHSVDRASFVDDPEEEMPSCCMGGCGSSKLSEFPGEEDASKYGSLNAAKNTTSAAKARADPDMKYVVPEGITPCCQHML